MTMKPEYRIKILAAAILFVLSAAVYFSPAAIPHKIAAGLLILTAFSAGSLPWTVTLAFFFSFLGDLAGSYKAGSTGDMPFLLQMAGFAAAHVCFIIYFIKRRGRGIPKVRCAGYAAFASAVLSAAAIIIVPCVPSGLLRFCVSGYAVIIAAMLLSALLTGDLLISAGAVLFVFSDFILATDIFVTDIPYSGYLVMVPYYAAQLIFFLRCAAICRRS